MKIGLIAELLRKPLYESVEYAAKIGAQGIQIYPTHQTEGGLNLLDCTDQELADFKAHCDKNGITISAVCGDGLAGSFQVEPECWERVEKMKKIFDAANKLGVRVVTTHIGCIPDSPQDPVYPTMVKSVRKAVEYAASKNCYFAIETGPELAGVLLRFIKDVDNDALRINLDPANLRGVSAEDPVYAVLTLAKYIVHTHAKDAVNTYVGSAAKFYGLRNPDGSLREISSRAAGFKEVPLGEGQVPWKAYLAALRASGYDGFLTIERECGADPVGDITKAVTFLRENLETMDSFTPNTTYQDLEYRG